MSRYVAAYQECYRWLLRNCPPWSWLMSWAMVPGSDLRRSLTALGGRP